MALTSLSNLKTYLSITSSTDDTILSSIIDRATSLIETYCNRTFAVTSYTEYCNGNNDVNMSLINYPITAITSITINNVVADSSTYSFDSYTGLIFLDNSYFPKGNRNIKVVYSAGYSSIPDDLEQICLDICADIYKSKNNSNNIEQEKIGDWQVKFKSQLSYNLLQPYQYILNKYINYNL